MYGLNMFALIIFGAVNILAVCLCKLKEGKRIRVIKVFCAVLLLINVIRDCLTFIFARKINFHVEFSAIAYFAVPVILLLGRKKLTGWAAYSGLMAGFFYYITMIVAGGSIYQYYPPFVIYISMFCHGTLFLCGFVTVSTQKCAAGDQYRLIAGIALVGLNAYLIRPLVNTTERIFIYELMDGKYIKQIFPQTLWGKALPVYYILLAVFVILSVIGFIKLNKTQYKKHMRA